MSSGFYSRGKAVWEAPPRARPPAEASLKLHRLETGRDDTRLLGLLNRSREGGLQNIGHCIAMGLNVPDAVNNGLLNRPHESIFLWLRSLLSIEHLLHCNKGIPYECQRNSAASRKVKLTVPENAIVVLLHSLVRHACLGCH